MLRKGGLEGLAAKVSSVVDLIGEQIGNYVVQRKLGQGGMGDVFLAEHPKIHRKAAIKVLKLSFGTKDSAADRFLTEARVVGQIKHPNVVEVFDFGCLEDGTPYYMMEYLEGRELRDVIASRGRMPPTEVHAYARRICAGIQAAHDLGIIHRDLKPENILVTSTDPLSLKVVDFGIAKLLEEKSSSITRTGEIIGSPVVMAPEQAAPEGGEISPAADVYSLGVILYWMLCGRPPFVAKTLPRMLSAHLFTDPMPLCQRAPDVPAALGELVDQCIRKLPHERPVSATRVAQRFARALEGAAPEVQGADRSVEPVDLGQLETMATPSGDGTLGEAETMVGRERPALETEATQVEAPKQITQQSDVLPPAEEPPQTSEAVGSGGRLLVGAVLIIVALGCILLVWWRPFARPTAPAPAPHAVAPTHPPAGAPEAGPPRVPQTPPQPARPDAEAGEQPDARPPRPDHGKARPPRPRGGGPRKGGKSKQPGIPSEPKKELGDGTAPF